ncbi:GNAT family N-acetyltransferase [Gimesia algae]|uniref:BioF2-like acetyltransferase domain-containing protein n=1 Tax=Gimesia algae TaxID=2527971 RepID=A0A517V9Z3_9PLAN|nr:hypothetical protein [Gimesia algae]QDT89788.1 hypothetical protein Pan161_14200 [Gimesia algae]
MITVAEINDIDRLDHFRLAWHALLGKTKGATFAHSPEWLEHYWNHFGHDQKLRILFITLGNKIIGIVPFVVKPVATKVGTMRVLTYPLDGWGSFYGQIGSNPAATMVTALRHIHASRRDWDLIDLRYIDQEGHDHRRTSNSFKSVGLQGNQAVWQKLPLIKTSETNWEDYLSSRSARTQQLISTSEQATRKQGHLAFYRSRLEDPLAPGWNPRWDLWAEFQQMNFLDGNQPNFAGGNFSTNKKIAFLHDIHGPAVRAGMARIDALFVNHSMVACAYGLQQDSGTDYLAVGRRNDAPREVITTLITRMVQQSIQNGEPSLNLGLVGNSLSEMWSNQQQVSYRCSHFPILAPRSQLLRMNRWIQKPVSKPSVKKISKTDSTIVNQPAGFLSQSMKPASCIEIIDAAPQDWSGQQEVRGDSSDDRPRFRIVG